MRRGRPGTLALVEMWARLRATDGTEARHDVVLDDQVMLHRVVTMEHSDEATDDHWTRWLHSSSFTVDRLPLRPMCAVLRLDEQAERHVEVLLNDQPVPLGSNLLCAGDRLSLRGQGSTHVFVRTQFTHRAVDVEGRPETMHWTFEPDSLVGLAFNAQCHLEPCLHSLALSCQKKSLEAQVYPLVGVRPAVRALGALGLSDANARAAVAAWPPLGNLAAATPPVRRPRSSSAPSPRRRNALRVQSCASARRTRGRRRRSRAARS